MTRAVLWGGSELAAAAEVLGLEAVDERPQVVIVDLRDASVLVPARGMNVPAHIPRIVIADDESRAIARAFGCPNGAIVPTADPAVLGPLVSAATPRSEREPTRLILITSARGGVGRTLL